MSGTVLGLPQCVAPYFCPNLVLTYSMLLPESAGPASTNIIQLAFSPDILYFVRDVVLHSLPGIKWISVQFVPPARKELLKQHSTVNPTQTGRICSAYACYAVSASAGGDSTTVAPPGMPCYLSTCTCIAYALLSPYQNLHSVCPAISLLVLTSRMLRDLSYAMPCTGLSYVVLPVYAPATRSPVLTWRCYQGVLRAPLRPTVAYAVSRGTVLRACYAMPGTGMAYVYGAYAMSGTSIPHAGAYLWLCYARY
eukprot:1884224-Rhodomonas_salina.3